MKGAGGASASGCAGMTLPPTSDYGALGPFATADEIKKALKLKAAFADMLDLMQ